jgi:hypothetical protein
MKARLMADLNPVTDDGAFFVADRLDLANRETAIAEGEAGFLESN